MNINPTGSISQFMIGYHSDAAPDDAAPQWIKLIPAGRFRGRDGRGPYNLKDPDAVIAATKANILDAGLPIDYNHATDLAAPEGRPAPAAGWVTELEAREGAVWGRVEWTEQGAAALAAREYRYISPVFEHDKDGRIVRIVRAALTNNPNLSLTAIASRQPRSNENKPEEGPLEDASTPASEPIAELRLERDRAKAETAVLEALQQGKLTPAQRDWAIDYCAADYAGFRRFLQGQPSWSLRDPILEQRPRRSMSQADPYGDNELSGVERAVCSRLGITTQAYLSRRAARSMAAPQE